MVDFWVAITWLAISAASVAGLSAAYARARVTCLGDSELTTFVLDSQFVCEDVYFLGTHSTPPSFAVGGLSSAAAGDVGAASL
jgi:hypothetical protein